MTWNVFVLGYDELGERVMTQLRHTADYSFYGLLPLDEVVNADRYSISKLREDAFRELDRFSGSVDAIVSYWDFPSSALAPLLRRRYGLPGPTLEAVLKCEHKYWSRVEQLHSIPDCVPRFQALDPFADDPVSDVELAYPFWIKPVKAHSSQLGFHVDDSDALRRVLPIIREGIGRFGEPLQDILQYADIPDNIATVTGHHCILESIVSAGHQCTLEGYVQGGEVHVYGVVDTIRHGRYPSVLTCYIYPSQLPETVQERMIQCTRQLMEHIRYDNAPFNIEFYHEPQNDQIWLLEVNSRLSRSHAPVFMLVDGAPHLQVMVDVGLGITPRMPRGEGRYQLAAKRMMRVFHDGIVRSIPSDADIARVEEMFPGTIVEINVREGMKLSDLLHQDSYSYELAVVFLGADNHQQLQERYDLCEEMLPFTIEPLSTPEGVPRET